MMQQMKLGRRTFLKSAALAGGGLAVGVTFPGLLARAARAADEVPLGAWLRIAPDGGVTVMVSAAEMGQGVYTSLPMIVADELGADWAKVGYAHALVDPAYANPAFGMVGTGGSTSVRAFYEPLRQAAAAAREMLAAAAAKEWGVAPADIRVADGVLRHEASGRSLGFGEVAAAAAALEVPQAPRLKAADELRLIGTRVPRLDLPAKVNGTAVFGMDVRLPDMAYGAVRAAPVFGAAVERVDRASIAGMPGVIDVVEVPNAVIVVADSTWRARQAADALDITFAATPHDGIDSAALRDAARRGLDATEAAIARNDGDVETALAGAARVVEAEYEVPFLAHATMEPMNATAHVTAEGCDIWAPTQGQDLARMVAGQITGLELDRIRVHTTLLGGGFGRRFAGDFIDHAVRASKAVGRPVKVVWSREEDMQHDYYRPAVVSRFRAGLDAEGKLVALSHRIVGPSIMISVFPDFVQNGLDPTSVEGSSDARYAIPNHHVDYVMQETHVPVGFWRSVGHSVNGFFTESMIDELAHAAGADPYRFRRGLLAHDERALKVLDTAAEAAGWGTPLPEGRARGIALHESFGSIVAEVAEVSVENGSPRIHRVVCAVDCGDVVNPDTVEAQMESGIVYGLTAALKGEITIAEGRVQQSNFHDYEMLTLSEMPVVETHIIRSGEALGGIGEPSTPPVAPAVTNALFALTGQRIRALPIRNHDLMVGG